MHNFEGGYPISIMYYIGSIVLIFCEWVLDCAEFPVRPLDVMMKSTVTAVLPDNSVQVTDACVSRRCDCFTT